MSEGLNFSPQGGLQRAMNGGVDGQAIKFCSVLSLLTAPFFGSLALSEIWSIAALLRIVQ